MSQSAPLRITRIELRDLRAIDHLVIDLDPGSDDEAGAMVIAAANGRGKTSVLEGVLLALGREDLLPADHAPYNEWVRQGAEQFVVSVATLSAPEQHITWTVACGFDGHLRDGDSRNVGGSRSGLRWRPAEQAAIELFSARREPEALGAIVSAPGRPSTREERRLHELKRRIVNAASRSNSAKVFDRISRFYQSFEGREWALEVVYASADDGADVIPVMHRGAIPEGENGDLLTWDRIVRGEAKGSTVVPLDRLSSGQMAILAMAYPFVFGPRLDVALIDEPEQHLHPTFQRALLPALRELSPQTQFIVATHSPYVLDSVPSYERVLLSSDDASLGHEAAQ
jgi:hypothetical protein